MVIKTNPAHNGNLNDLIGKRFTTKIIIKDFKSYGEILDYLEKEALRGGLLDSMGSEKYYVFDEQGEQVAKTKGLLQMVELTKASEEIKKGIYSKLEIE